MGMGGSGKNSWFRLTHGVNRLRLDVLRCCLVQPFKNAPRCRNRLLVAVALHKVNDFVGTSPLNDVVPEGLHAGVVHHVSSVVAPLGTARPRLGGIGHRRRLVQSRKFKPRIVMPLSHLMTWIANHGSLRFIAEHFHVSISRVGQGSIFLSIAPRLGNTSSSRDGLLRTPPGGIWPFAGCSHSLLRWKLAVIAMSPTGRRWVERPTPAGWSERSQRFHELVEIRKGYRSQRAI